eukprot:761569_1
MDLWELCNVTNAAPITKDSALQMINNSFIIAIKTTKFKANLINRKYTKTSCFITHCIGLSLSLYGESCLRYECSDMRPTPHDNHQDLSIEDEACGRGNPSTWRQKYESKPKRPLI